MKKVLLLVGIMVLVLSFSVFAEGPAPVLDPLTPEAQTALEALMTGYDNMTDDDGIIIGMRAEESIVAMDRDAYEDVNGDNQDAEVNVTAEAFIPCKLEITVTGNDGQAWARSFGPDAAATVGPNYRPFGYIYRMVFDNGIGGFVGEDWAPLGHDDNAELQPGEGLYIQACDIFRVDTYSNDDYKYEVVSAPLNAVNAASGATALDLQMRTYDSNAVVLADPLDNWSFGTDGSPCTIDADIPACESRTYLHQFRVPYDDDVRHGKYSGIVTFKVATI